MGTSDRASVAAFFDQATGTVSYVVHDASTLDAAIIDPVLGFDAGSGQTNTAQADKLIAHVQATGLTIRWILETHAHADHLTSARYLQGKVGGKIAIGARIAEVQSVSARFFNLHSSRIEDGSTFNHLLNDNEVLELGGLSIRAVGVPGHTPADMAFVVDDVVFVGDTLFMPDVGTARTDFPGGDARELYRSIRRLLALPADTRIFVCHDYPPPGRAAAWETTVAQERAENIHIRDGITADAFAAMRTERDRTLPLPKLIYHAVQVNVCGGQLPPPEDNGISYLKIPLNSQSAFSNKTGAR